jgi:L-fucose mutarotase
MLKGKLIHPEILGALGTLGHGSKILIADGNYPLGTRLAPDAHAVYLNLTPGVPTATQVLEALLTAIPLEAAQVMLPADGKEPAIFAEFRAIIKAGIKADGAAVDLEGLERFAFYDAASSPDVGLGILTAEQRVYANILLTIGVVK